MPDWEQFDTGPVPTVRVEDLRTALAVIVPIRRSGVKGIWGSTDERWQDLLRSGCNMAALTMRSTIVAIALDQGVLDRWREGDTLQDAVFEVAASYPWAMNEQREMNPDFEGFIRALEAG